MKTSVSNVAESNLFALIYVRDEELALREEKTCSEHCCSTDVCRTEDERLVLWLHSANRAPLSEEAEDETLSGVPLAAFPFLPEARHRRKGQRVF